MATIRDVAKLAEVSPTTVSLVISDKAANYGIPESTCKRVQQAMNELHYHPNLYARNLRSKNTKQRPVLAFYWPQGERMGILAMFISAFQNELRAINFDCELVVQTYVNDELDKSVSHILSNEYHAVIVGGTSKSDIEYLDSLHIKMPVVVINRASSVYSSVQADNYQVAQMAADLFLHNKYTDIGIIAMKKPYVATNYRMTSFIKICRENGIQIPEQNIVYEVNTMEGGLEAAKRLTSLSKRPPAVFVESDTMALGAVYHFNRAGIRIPQDLSLVAINMSSGHSTQYSTPSITVVDMPSADIAKAVITVVTSLLRDSNRAAMHITFNGKVLFRESFQLNE